MERRSPIRCQRGIGGQSQATTVPRPSVQAPSKNIADLRPGIAPDTVALGVPAPPRCPPGWQHWSQRAPLVRRWVNVERLGGSLPRAMPARPHAGYDMTAGLTAYPRANPSLCEVNAMRYPMLSAAVRLTAPSLLGAIAKAAPKPSEVEQSIDRQIRTLRFGSGWRARNGYKAAGDGDTQVAGRFA